MSRGFSGSGQAVSLDTAIAKLFVRDITSTSATVYWGVTPNVRRSGFRYVVKNLTEGTQQEPVSIAGNALDNLSLSLNPETMYEVIIENLYGTGVLAGTFKPSTPASVTFETDVGSPVAVVEEVVPV